LHSSATHTHTHTRNLKHTHTHTHCYTHTHTQHPLTHTHTHTLLHPHTRNLKHTHTRTHTHAHTSLGIYFICYDKVTASLGGALAVVSYSLVFLRLITGAISTCRWCAGEGGEVLANDTDGEPALQANKPKRFRIYSFSKSKQQRALTILNTSIHNSNQRAAKW
jgi:hypothetical protein